MSAGSEARRLALEVLRRIDEDGAYANLALGAALDRSTLDRRDRAFCTDLVYGTTRMRRACDHLLDSFLHDEVEPAVVSATVAVAPRRGRGLCNAVLRRLVGHTPDWPSPAVELSQPDWLVDRLVEDLGEAEALGALAAMNTPAPAVARSDGYQQDRASQLVAELAVEDLTTGESVLDLCAAPGGKATAMAGAGARVTAMDLRWGRLGLVRSNATGLGLDLGLVAADGLRPPFRHGSFDRVLVDAPCSGLGVLRRRADARWRATPEEVPRLADLQVGLLEAALPLLRPGGLLVYSVCTLTAAETTGVDGRFRQVAGVEAEPPGPPWRSHGSGGLLLPQDLDSEGMAAFRYRAG